MSSDLSSIMEEVAKHYLGQPNLKLSTKKELRWGNHGSMKVNIENGTWFNHEEGVGGGVTHLIKRFDKIRPTHQVLKETFGIESDFETIQPSTFRQLIAQYDYFDKDGELKYSVERFEWFEGQKKQKSFRQKRYEGAQEIYKMEGVIPLPYNLPQILQRPKATIFVVEGEKSVAALNKLGILAATNHGGSSKWFPELNQYFNGRNVIIIPDNDVPGKSHAINVANALLGSTSSLKILTLDGLPEKGDVVEWIESGGTKDKLIELAKAASLFTTKIEESISVVSEEKVNFRFKVMTKQDLISMPPPQWLIEDIFPLKSFGVIYGEPGKGKTFISLDMALSIANGFDWKDKATIAGSVLYIAGEGVGGLGKRIKAWDKKFNGKSEVPFYAIPSQINMRSEDDINEILKIIDSFQQNFSIIFIDTVARAILGGDENSSTDMGQFIAACDVIKNHTGATVIGVHHSGKDTDKGMRGSSALLGAVDTCLLIEQSDDKLVSLKMEKQKDAESIDPMTFDIEIIDTGIDETSIVLNLSEKTVSQGNKVTGKERQALQFLRDAIASSSYLIRGMPAAKLDSWKAECYNRGLSMGEDAAKRQCFNRVSEKLIRDGIVIVDGGLVAIKV